MGTNPGAAPGVGRPGQADHLLTPLGQPGQVVDSGPERRISRTHGHLMHHSEICPPRHPLGGMTARPEVAGLPVDDWVRR